MAAALEIDRHPLEDGVELELRGELEISTVPLLRRALREVRDEDVSLVRLDISGLEFVDSTGLRAPQPTRRSGSATRERATRATCRRCFSLGAWPARRVSRTTGVLISASL